MSKPVRLAVLGVGNIGTLHATAIARIESTELAAVYSRSEERAKAAGTKFGVAWSTDLDEILSREDIDAVSICSPSGTHGDLAVAAAEAGKHLLVEKPIEITTERVDQIIAAAERNNVKLAGIFPARFRAGAQKLKSALDQGRLGTLSLCDAYVKWHRTQEYYDTGGWRGTWKLDGGGALMNQAIHHVDLLVYLAGEVESVMGWTQTRAHTMETEDTAAAVLRFKSGATGVIEASTASWPGSPGRLDVSGSSGTVTLEDVVITRWDIEGAGEDEQQRMLNLETAEGSGSTDPMGISSAGHVVQITDFAEAIRHDRPPVIDGREGRKAVAIVEAIYRSAREGRAVELI